MISPNDLRQILRNDAENAPDTAAHEVLAGVQHKIKVRRRARIAGSLAAFAAILAASLTIVPQVVDRSSPEPVEPIPEPPTGAQWTFTEHVLSNSILFDSSINEPGSSSLTWTTALGIPARRNLIALICELPDDQDAGFVKAVATVDGVRIVEARCEQQRTRSALGLQAAGIGSVSSDWLRRADESYMHGETFTMSVWLERNGRRIEADHARFGVALYRLPKYALDRDQPIP